MRWTSHLQHLPAGNVAILAYDLPPDPGFCGLMRREKVAILNLTLGGSSLYLFSRSLRRVIVIPSSSFSSVGLSAAYDRNRKLSHFEVSAHCEFAIQKAIYTPLVEGTLMLIFPTR